MTNVSQYMNILSKSEQDKVFDIILNNNVFLTGLPGSGKTYLTRKYIDFCIKNNINIGVTASTGIAAKLLGMKQVGYESLTIHSWSGVDIVDTNDTFEIILNRVIKKPKHVKRWKNTKVLIIDEISLIDDKLFTFLDRIGKHIRNNDKVFGGIKLLVVGDFYQLPPVNGKYCFESDIWNNSFNYYINLDTSYRSNDDSLNKILKRIRKGKQLLPNMIKALQKRNSKKVLNVERFPIMVPLRDMARNINNNKMSENKNKEHYFKATYNNKDNCSFIQKLSPLEDELVLKIGCPVINLVNDHTRGLTNGMVGTVVDFIDMKPIVNFNNMNVVIEKHIWEKTDNSTSVPKLLRMEQFPLLLSYAITIHRSQGQTLSQASIVLDSRVWERSQSYVALSRLESLNGLNLLEFDPVIFNIIRKNDIKVKDYYKKWKNYLKQ
jgi:ATP-dependent DNA helicase PIF1